MLGQVTWSVCLYSMYLSRNEIRHSLSQRNWPINKLFLSSPSIFVDQQKYDFIDPFFQEIKLHLDICLKLFMPMFASGLCRKVQSVCV